MEVKLGSSLRIGCPQRAQLVGGFDDGLGAMRIPVFVSCPTRLNAEQKRSRDLIVGLLAEFGLEDRALGRSDYSTDYPLREIYIIARHCSGGLILGFEQAYMASGVVKRGTEAEAEISEPKKLPTPWNQLEAGILFGMKLPLLIFKEPGIEGGIFDSGMTDAYLQEIPPGDLSPDKKKQLVEVLLRWRGRVSEHYYRY